MTDKLIAAAVGICKHAVEFRGWIFWEWPSTSDLWKTPAVQKLFSKAEAFCQDVSAAALGMKFQVKVEEKTVEKFIKKKWRIYSNHADFLARISQYARKHRKGKCELPTDACEDFLERSQRCRTPEHA